MPSRALPTRIVLGSLMLGLFALAACPGDSGEEAEVSSPVSTYRSPPRRAEVVQQMLADRAAVRHASDGGGRAWLEADATGEPPQARARQPGRWTIVYEAGPLGIALGGTLLFQVGPYWNWDQPQVVEPEARGYTRVSSPAEGVRLECESFGQWSLGVRVLGRELRQGERIHIEYGAGTRGARADDWFERESRFWLRVDGDGDGVSGLLPDAPALTVHAGPPARLLLTLSSGPQPGVDARRAAWLSAAVVDAVGNACTGVSGQLEWLDWPAGLAQPAAPRLAAERWSSARVELEVLRAGIHRVRARVRVGEHDLEAWSNPLLEDGKSPIWWGDLHGHTNLSDGSGTPEDWFDYARWVAALDFAALTDHDHWGMRFVDENEDLRERLQAAARRANAPREFTSLHGYEWTSWLYGHRHVLFFDDAPVLLSSLDPATDAPDELWRALRGKPAVTLAHHSAGGPIATDWSFTPDAELEPVTEIVSVHGSSEAEDTPRRIYAPVAGNFVRDQLERGLRLGFVGSGDGHDGHPGLAHFGGSSGGLAAVHARENTREDLLDALRRRDCYASSGPRIALRAELAGHPMGAVISANSLGQAEQCLVRVAGTAPLARLDLVRGRSVASSVECGGALDFETSFALDGLDSGEFVYVRVVQADGHFACSSPFFVE